MSLAALVQADEWFEGCQTGIFKRLLYRRSVIIRRFAHVRN